MATKPDECPVCHGRKCAVINSRPHPTKRVRRRKCLDPTCGYRWDAYESLIDPDDIPPGLRERLSA